MNRRTNKEEIENLIEKLRKESENRQKINEIIDITEKNPGLLENLSIKQLQVIDNYYDENFLEILQYKNVNFWQFLVRRLCK